MQGDERLRRPALDRVEDHQQDGAGEQARERGGMGPAVLARLGEAVDQGEQAEGDGQRAGQVDPGPVGRARLLDGGGRDQQDGERDGHVDEEGPAPGEQVGQHAAEDRAGGEPGRHQGAVQPERLLPQRSLGEGGGEQGQARRGGGGRREPLGDAGGDEDLGGRREAAGEGGQAQQGEAGEEDPLAADEVADPAEEQGEPGRRQGEGGGDPLQVRQGEAEAVADEGEGDVQDREVDGERELGDQQDREDEFEPAGEPWWCGGDSVGGGEGGHDGTSFLDMGESPDAGTALNGSLVPLG